MPNLTELAIKAASAGTLWDSSLKGFGLRVGKHSKTFIVLVESGRRKKLGRYPLLTLAQAREQAKRILAEKQLGKVRPTFTPFAEARDAYLADCTHLRPSTLELYRRHCTVHFPFQRKAVADIAPADILKNLKGLPPSEKEHAFRYGRRMFRWFLNNHLIETSPFERLEKPPAGTSRDRVLSEHELRIVYRTAHRATSGFHRLILAIIHTGGRRNEVTRLEWPYIVKDTLTFRGATRKVRKTQEHDHTIPIGPKFQAILKTFPRFDGNQYLFPATRTHVRGKATTVMTGYSDMMRDFLEETGTTHWTPHDLRRTMVTVMCEKLDVLPHIADWIIAHVSAKPSGAAHIYNRAVYLRQARDAIGRWEQYLSSLLRN